MQMISFQCDRCGRICAGDYKETDTRCEQCAEIVGLQRQLTASQERESRLRRALEEIETTCKNLTRDIQYYSADDRETASWSRTSTQP